MKKIRLAVTEEQVRMLSSLVAQAQQRVAEKLRAAKADDERTFYEKQTLRLEALYERLSEPMIADTSQDAEPDEDDETI